MNMSIQTSIEMLGCATAVTDTNFSQWRLYTLQPSHSTHPATAMHHLLRRSKTHRGLWPTEAPARHTAPRDSMQPYYCRCRCQRPGLPPHHPSMGSPAAAAHAAPRCNHPSPPRHLRAALSSCAAHTCAHQPCQPTQATFQCSPLAYRPSTGTVSASESASKTRWFCNIHGLHWKEHPCEGGRKLNRLCRDTH